MRKNRNLKAIYINRFKEMWPEFTRISAQCHTVRFDEDQQGADIWLPIPSEFLKGELSDEERKAVAGRSIMIRWDILKGLSKDYELYTQSSEAMIYGSFIRPMTRRLAA